MFHPIDFEKYPRAEVYRHFRSECPCAYNVTALCDVTRVRERTKARGFRFYAAMIWLLGRVVNAHEEFRIAERDGVPGVYDVCHPSYTVPNGVPEGFSGIWTPYEDDFVRFHEAYLRDVAEYSPSTRYAPKPDQPENTYYVSCVPDLSFLSLDMSLPADALSPIFTLGRFSEEGGRTRIPVAARLHHAACDGFHAARLFRELQTLADRFDF